MVKKIPEHIHIIGGSGAGCSTLGRQIAHLFNYLFWDSDDFYWELTDPPYTKARNREFRIKMIKHALEFNKKWVLSGSLCGWGDFLIPQFDLVIWLTLPQEIRIKRLVEREKRDFGARINKGGDMYENFTGFIQWAKEYDNGDENMRSMKQHELWTKKLSCPVVKVNDEVDFNNMIDIIESSFK